MTVRGANLIGGEESTRGRLSFRPVDPRTGRPGDLEVHEAGVEEVEEAAREAAEAFRVLRSWPPHRLGELLRACADSLEGIREPLLERADRETALGISPRLTAELTRTTEQLRAFARMVEEGWHLEAIIDHAAEGRPDVRRMLIPLGPVAVFGASNFPLAFSVPGGDTASALAAGCPVVAKAHPSHPGTSEQCGRAISEAVRSVGAPPGTFSMVQGISPEVGRALVLAPEIRAVGFTGSLAAGRTIHELGATRPEPIPVYSEMGSLNPVFVSRGAAAQRSEEIARGYAASMTLGVGQFCTKPGLAFLAAGAEEPFLESLVAELSGMEPAVMLNEGIFRAFRERLAETSRLPGVQMVLEAADGEEGFACSPGLLRADLDSFLRHERLSEEHFGPVSVVVTADPDRMVEAARRLPGSLTATIHALPGEVEELRPLQEELVGHAGRIIWNGYPTGVAVVPSMHHGGPYPATTNPLHTSVGMTAVRRFLRPVAFQDVPAGALPPALRDDNPLGMLRMVDWQWTVG